MKKIHYLTKTLLATVLALGLMTGCEEDATADDIDDTGASELITTDYDLISIHLGDSTSIGINPVNSDGNTVAFTATTIKDCATMTVTDSAINIQATAKACTQVVTVQASGFADKNITINVLDTMSMDIGEGLLIRYVNVYQSRYKYYNPFVGYVFSMYHPQIGESGWYALGSYVHAGGDATNSTDDGVMIMVKDSLDAGLLVQPDGYTLVSNDIDVPIWKPTCQSGYVAMGFVSSTSASTEPTTKDVVCVREDFTSPGKIDTDAVQSYDDGLISTKFYPITTADTYSGIKAQLPTGAFVNCKSSTSCDEEMINTLLIPIKAYNTSDNSAEPLLTDYTAYDASQSKYSSSIRLPFTLIPTLDTDASMWNFNVTESPFYELKRKEDYTSIASYNNKQGDVSASQSYTTKTTFDETQSSSFSQTIGLEVTASGGINILGSGADISATVSGELGWETSVSSSYSTSTSITTKYTIPSGKFGEILQVTTSFLAVGNTGLEVTDPLTGSATGVIYLQYPR